MTARLRNLAAATACFLAVLGSVAVRADPIEERAVLSGKARLDVAKGYIHLHGSDRIFGVFLRVPDDATRAEYQQDWAKAFAKEQKHYKSVLENWRVQVAVAKQARKDPPEMPPEPTAETFSIGPIELRDRLSFGPLYAFAKSDARVSYLEAVKPGTYIWYGPVMLNTSSGAAFGLCDCMGTVRFEVKPGVVTDLGNFLIAAPEPTRTHDVAVMTSWQLAEEKAAKTGKPAELPRTPLVYGLPDSLKAWPSVRAEFHASGKMNNYFGILVTRMAPIPGIMGYRRDTVIDARAGLDVPNPPIVTQAKVKS